MSTTINKEEIQKFSRLADEWWDVNGKFKPLHMFNPIRIEYITEKIKIHFKLKDVSFKDWTKLFFWTTVTHPLLDAHTTWGTQFFWPFNYRLAYQNIFVVDPIYTLPFLGFLIIAMSLKKENPRRSKFNNIGLSVSSTYLILTLIFKWISFQEFKQGLENQKDRICRNGYQAISIKCNTMVVLN